MRILLYIFFLLVSSQAVCQTQKQWLKYADKSFGEKDYYGASVYYREAMLLDSSNLYVVFRYAESLRHYNHYTLAERYYNYVYRKDRGRQYPGALFWLGMMQKNNARYADARKTFLAYSRGEKNKETYYYKKSVQEVRSCEYALELVNHPVKAVVFNLGDSINTTNAEFAAIKVGDSAIFFSSLPYASAAEKMMHRKQITHFTSIYEASKADTLWKKKRALDSVINKAGYHTANGCLAPDGKKFYFTRCNTELHCDLYVSERKDTSFTTAIPLEKINDPVYSSTQPYVSVIEGKEILFFASGRPGGQGGLDIWYSIKEGDAFTEAVNAGPVVNTMEDDISPYYDTIGQALFFSSPWHYGLGGFDIFKSPGKPGTFTTPENIGFPVNSSANDLYFTYEDTTLAGFLTSNRRGSVTNENETCCNDLWKFEIEPELTVKDSLVPVARVDPLEELGRFLPIKLYFHNDEPNPRTRDTITGLSYTETYAAYRQLIPDYEENYSRGLQGERKSAAEDTIRSFFSNTVEKNYAMLQEFAEALLRQLEKGYNLELTVRGHASPLANTDYNVMLTLRRISSLENFLRSYKGGAFVPYLSDSAANGGSLKLIRVPFGEYKAETYVSDNYHDRKNSVYSIGAALNRNIEIVSVSLELKDSVASRIAFRREVHDFGVIRAGSKVTYSFRFRNTGKAPLTIHSFETSCACLTVNVPSEPVAPGDRGEVQIIWDTAGLKGKQVQSVTLLTNGVPQRKELNVTAEVK